MNKFILSFFLVLCTLMSVASSAAPTRLPTATPTRSAEQIFYDRTFGHKITDHEYGGVVVGIIFSFVAFIAIIYFVFNSMKA